MSRKPVILCLLISFGLLAGVCFGKYSGGTGEPNDPYLIATPNDLNSIGLDTNDWDKHFKMIADINMSGITGTQFNIIGNTYPNPFVGDFDGNSHSIINFSYNEAGGAYIGLFGIVNGPNAEIKNLTLIDPNINGSVRVGSLVGWLEEGTIDNCTIIGATVTGDSDTGGLAGVISSGYTNGGKILNSSATGSISGTGDCVGGLVGNLSGIVLSCSAEVNVSGSDHSEDVGGLVGFHGYTETLPSYIMDSNSTGTVTGGDFCENVGGLVGRLGGPNCQITNSYSTSLISCGEHGTSIGALVGDSSGTISSCYATGSISGGFDSYNLGGLVGYQQQGTIVNCHATGSIGGSYELQEIGGLVGYQNDGMIDRCYAIGNITGHNRLGGLCGRSSGTITYCYSSGSVYGEDTVGGLTGLLNEGTLENCYAVGSVSGLFYSGGLVGRDPSQNGLYFACFWNKTVNPALDGISNWPSNPEVYEETTANLKMASTFTDKGWDFVGETTNGTEDIWDILENESYPYLRSNPPLYAICSSPKSGESVPNQTSGVDLIWQAGVTAVSHNVYFGSSNPPSFQTNQTETTWFTGPLLTDTTYYWRIDEMDSNGLAIPGETWNFNIIELGAGGLGTSEDPIIIETAEQLNDVGSHSEQWDKHFRLVNDLDLSYYDGLEGRPAFNIIGYVDEWPGTAFPFTGIFDGNNHVVSNFRYVDPNQDYVGLFGYLGRDGQIKNLGVKNVTVEGNWAVGSVVGYINYASVTSCFSTGSVSGYQQVGGLVGCNNDSMITYCYSKASATGNDYVGGLVSSSYDGIINSCYCTGLVSGNSKVGGLIGQNHGGVIASFWDVNTSGQTTSDGGHGLTTVEMQDEYFYSVYGWGGDVWTLPENDYPRLYWENAGGDYIDDPCVAMAGSGTSNDPWQVTSVNDFVAIGSGNYFWDKHYLLISNVDLNDINVNRIGYDAYNTFTGTFDGDGHTIFNFRYVDPNQDYVGLFGSLGPDGYVENLGVIDVNIEGHWGVGALVGSNASGTVNSCFSTGSVVGYKTVGGIAGYNGGSIMSCFSNSSVKGHDYVGGLAGGNGGTITYCYNDGPVSGISFIGGLVGDSSSSSVITYCHNTGTVTGTDRFAGGLCGYDYLGNITDCYNTGLINGNDWVGGLVGQFIQSTITNSYNTGSVVADYAVGGLVGSYKNSATSACYSSGSVNARRNLGGLVGIQESGTITNCYSTGDANGNTFYVGGLVGEMISGTTTNCYAAGSISGSSWLGGLVGDISSGSITNCYFLHPDDGGGPDNGYGTPLHDPNMKIQDSFVGWDFIDQTINEPNDVWRMCIDGVNYPKLSWEFSGYGDLTCPDGVDFIDYSILANEWQLERLEQDYNSDGRVNFKDWAIFANNWEGSYTELPPFVACWLARSTRIADIAPAGGDDFVNWQDLATLAMHWLEGTE